MSEDYKGIEDYQIIRRFVFKYLFTARQLMNLIQILLTFIHQFHYCFSNIRQRIHEAKDTCLFTSQIVSKQVKLSQYSFHLRDLFISVNLTL
jgi:hypothetical protein